MTEIKHYRNRLFFKLISLLVLFVNCKSNDKEEHIKSKRLENILLKSALKTDDDTIKEVSIVFYEGKKGEKFQPKENFIFRLKKDKQYFKYTNFSEESLLSDNMKDSILIDKKEKIDNFFKHKNTLLKDVYGDTIGEKPIWKIYFINKGGLIFKFIDINGEPKDQDLINLKTSCDFLMEKIKNISTIKNNSQFNF
jgi:hypothetical protein